MKLLLHVDPILRGVPLDALRERSQRQTIERSMLIVLFVMIYGGVMGSWGLFSHSADDQQWLFSLYSAVKAPLLLVATFLLSLPPLFVFYTLAGLRSDFWRVVQGLTEMQTVLSIILGGLAPFTLLWYASSNSYPAGVLFNAMMFAIATFAAPSLMRRHLRPLAHHDRRHRHLLKLWILLYVFIGIQMGWVLRPFIGSPGSEVAFIRFDDLDNAYVTVMEMILKVLSS